jgi:sRNA-binding carbon storage regulator CsrA
MLVLTRKGEEGISLDLPDGRRIRLFAEVVGANKVKLVIDAPEDVRVGRLQAAKPPKRHAPRGKFTSANTQNGVPQWKTQNTTR